MDFTFGNARLALLLCVAVGPYFVLKGLNFFRYFAGKGAKFRENFAKISKFQRNFEISLRAHMRTCIQLPYLSISLTRFPSQNEVPRFVPL